MAAQSKIELTCDLCKYPPQILPNERQAQLEGWVKIGHESYYEDRAFYDSWVCPDCVKQLVAAVEKVKK